MLARVFLVVILLSASNALALRLVSTSPQNTEWLFQLGQGDRLVATSSFSEYPSEAAKLPTLGPLFMPALEKTLRLRPDLVVIDKFTTPLSYEQGLGATGTKVMSALFPTLDALFEISQSFLQSHDPSSLHHLEKFRLCRAAVEKQKRLPFTFLAFAWSDPPILFGHATLISDVLVLSGGKNLVPHSGENPFPQLSEEWLLKNQPDQIFFVSYSAEADVPFYRDFPRWWPNLKPVSLPASHFGRSTFSPLLSISRFVQPPIHLKECDVAIP